MREISGEHGRNCERLSRRGIRTHFDQVPAKIIRRLLRFREGFCPTRLALGSPRTFVVFGLRSGVAPTTGETPDLTGIVARSKPDRD